MKSKVDVYVSLVLLVIDLARVVYAGPHEFCLDNFNASDCGKAPTDVVYFSCQHFCIMRIWGGAAVDLSNGVHKQAQVELSEELEKADVDEMDSMDQALYDTVEAERTKKNIAINKNKKAESEENGEPEEVIVMLKSRKYN